MSEDLLWTCKCLLLETIKVSPKDFPLGKTPTIVDIHKSARCSSATGIIANMTVAQDGLLTLGYTSAVEEIAASLATFLKLGRIEDLIFGSKAAIRCIDIGTPTVELGYWLCLPDTVESGPDTYDAYVTIGKRFAIDFDKVRDKWVRCAYKKTDKRALFSTHRSKEEAQTYLEHPSEWSPFIPK